MTSTSIKNEKTKVSEENLKPARRNAASFVIVWLDTAFGTNNNLSKTIEQLEAINNDVEAFNDSDACFDYVTNLTGERVLFIVSDSIHPCILTLAQDLPAVSALYITCSSEAVSYEKYLEHNRKIKGIFYRTDDLIEQIKSDTDRVERELIGLEMVDVRNITCPISRNSNKQECSFMYSQLLKEVLFRFEDDGMSELVEYAQTLYADNPSQRAIIDQFKRDYQPNKAVWWYTRDCFLYKIVNKALRTQDVEALYSMRTFIRHLHQQLSQLNHTNDHIESASVLTLYRGQLMSIGEFEKLRNNKGGLLSVSNFLSTSKNRDVAVIFAGQSDDTMIATVWELTVNLNHRTNSSFACVENMSVIGEDEREWLFSMGTVFRIGEVEQVNNSWHIYLTLTNDEYEILEKLTIHMRRLIQIERPNPLVPLCRLFARMGVFEKAVELCEENMAVENDWEIEATLYDALALKYLEDEHEDENLVLRYHQQALDTVAKYVNEDDPLLASYHNNVAISCSAVNLDKKAIEHYRTAIKLELKASHPDYTNIAYSYESMGHIFHCTDENYSEALVCYEHALELMLKYLPSTHLDIFTLQKDMAEIYEKQNQDDKALEMLYKCLGAEQKSAECSPDDVALTCKRIADIYTKLKKFKEASEMRKKYHQLKAASSSSIDRDLNNRSLEIFFAKIGRPDGT